MRKSFAVALAVVLAVSGSQSLFAQKPGTLQGVAQGEDKAPLQNFTIRVRNANTGDLAGSTTSNQAGEFAFDSLNPGNYVVEILDATGNVVGLSPAIPVEAGSTITVKVGATAAGALSKKKGGLALFGLGPIASVAVVGAASAAAVTAVVATRNGKITVCHVAGNARQTLQISESARSAHLGHGDTLGACPASPSR